MTERGRIAMRQMIEISELLSNDNFLTWFLMMNFPEGIDPSRDCTLFEMMQEEYTVDETWADDLTGYCEGVLDESDGYIEDPKAIMLRLSTGDYFCMEFHPGDTLYYINDNEIGCTGPSYEIRKLSLPQFYAYTRDLGDLETLFLLPMLRITDTEKEELTKMIQSILGRADFTQYPINDVCTCIVENCLE